MNTSLAEVRNDIVKEHYGLKQSGGGKQKNRGLGHGNAFGWCVEDVLGFSGDGIADDEDVVEADAVVEDVASEGVEEVEDEGLEVDTGEDFEDGDKGGVGVVEVGLAVDPVEEHDALYWRRVETTKPIITPSLY